MQYFKIIDFLNMLADENWLPTKEANNYILNFFAEKFDLDFKYSEKIAEKALKKTYKFLKLRYEIETFESSEIKCYFLAAAEKIMPDISKYSDNKLVKIDIEYVKVVLTTSILFVTTLFLYAYIKPRCKLQNVTHLQDKIYMILLTNNLIQIIK